MLVHLHVKVTPEQSEALKKREREVGVSVSEQVRRALDAAQKGDNATR